MTEINDNTLSYRQEKAFQKALGIDKHTYGLENQADLTEGVSEFLLNQNAKDKAKKVSKEIMELLE